jgi:hypothetical protein
MSRRHERKRENMRGDCEGGGGGGGGGGGWSECRAGGEEGIGEIRTIHANVGPILLNDHTAHKILTR